MDSILSSIKRIEPQCIVIGAGLAGSECSWQLACRGLKVALIEQRPQKKSPAHKTGDCAELVCSNSLKSTDPLSAAGVLKSELTQMGSLILEKAFQCRVPAGHALAVDRVQFSKAVSQALHDKDGVEIIQGEVTSLNQLREISDAPIVIATGPLTSDALSEELSSLLGQHLSFYDAISPIIDSDSIDRSVVFSQNRYDKGDEGSSPEGDYLNCPLNKEEYERFVELLKSARRIEEHSFEKIKYFQGCQPIEAIADKGDRSLAFGPMKPKGLRDPRTQKRPYAAVQLRKEDNEGRAWNMVGFQTKMAYPEQERVFRCIPGLEAARFYRLGSIHRNTYIDSPRTLKKNLELKTHNGVFFAGQITGVEGYLESTSMGLYAALQLESKISRNAELPPPPATTALGALIERITDSSVKDFQPININWGLVPLMEIPIRDSQKKEKLKTRAQEQFSRWLSGENSRAQDELRSLPNRSTPAASPRH